MGCGGGSRRGSYSLAQACERFCLTRGQTLQSQKSLLISQLGKLRPSVQVTQLLARGRGENPHLTEGNQTRAEGTSSLVRKPHHLHPTPTPSQAQGLRLVRPRCP